MLQMHRKPSRSKQIAQRRRTGAHRVRVYGIELLTLWTSLALPFDQNDEATAIKAITYAINQATRDNA